MASQSQQAPTQFISTFPAPKDGDEVAVLETNFGRIVLQLFPDKAPIHVKRFKELIEKHFYDGTKFHRVIPGFMIQGGDPNTKGSDRSTYGHGGPGYTIPAEHNDVSHVRGVLSAARMDDPDSAGSQFFIVVGDSTYLNGQYDPFGRVLEGMDVADKIVALPTDGEHDPLPGHEAVVKTIRLEKWPIKGS